ncbi:GNAT family N-acetyltransferase [Candidatus Nephthysia bennettiae]|uniref:GNAT family N-acetyltransferase n=1 Tax=Candidatus Nephthysia bennettiae TaxID=3127016 RepID=A0A934N7X1_9BACT|nr:GNAT family N-acetyltransferase [Candidatus Dormibacteraeota bacterium]MBJ7612151.1 GNAT family N-acetyltransferase [Candidatus Dormibacteraeota bacterium]
MRPAAPADVEVLAAIRQEREGGHLPELARRFFRALAEPAGGRVLLVGLIEGEVSGYGLAGHFDPPADSPANHAPAGWYLQGLVVRVARRRLGLGAELTRRRLEWLSGRAERAYYFANSANQASIALHAGLGFQELSRDFWYPDVTFIGGEGVLFGIDLRDQGHL